MLRQAVSFYKKTNQTSFFFNKMDGCLSRLGKRKRASFTFASHKRMILNDKSSEDENGKKNF